MDPKSIANLDPKLRETYERVMGSTSGGASAPSNPPANPSTPAAPTPSDPFSTASPAAPSTATPPPAPDAASPATPTAPPSADGSGLSAPLSTDPPLSPTPSSDTNASLTNAPAAVFNSSAFGIPTNSPGGAAAADLTGAAAGLQPLASPAAAAQTAHGTSALIKILYIFGGIIFFIVYIFFWIKIFNYQLPF